MKSLIVKIMDPIGIHARPASTIVSVASKFESTVTFKFVEQEKIANAKSVINLMSLGAKKDTKIEIIISGSDEEAAVDAIKKVMVENNFAQIL